MLGWSFSGLPGPLRKHYQSILHCSTDTNKQKEFKLLVYTIFHYLQINTGPVWMTLTAPRGGTALGWLYPLLGVR